MFDVIERLKTEWTDKYVVIDSPAPELARFARSTGQVKTVNMNGRCLVEFDQYNNVAWYDIDPSCLRVVPKPPPKPPESKEKPSKSEKPAAKPVAVAKPAAATKPSTADILAAARGKAAAGGAKAASGKLSTAEILARARGGTAAPADSKPAESSPATAEPDAAEPVAEPSAKARTAAPQAGSGTTSAPPTNTAEKIAWCRAHDARA